MAPQISLSISYGQNTGKSNAIPFSIAKNTPCLWFVILISFPLYFCSSLLAQERGVVTVGFSLAKPPPNRRKEGNEWTTSEGWGRGADHNEAGPAALNFRQKQKEIPRYFISSPGLKSNSWHLEAIWSWSMGLTPAVIRLTALGGGQGRWVAWEREPRRRGSGWGEGRGRIWRWSQSHAAPEAQEWPRI